MPSQALVTATGSLTAVSTGSFTAVSTDSPTTPLIPLQNLKTERLSCFAGIGSGQNHGRRMVEERCSTT